MSMYELFSVWFLSKKLLQCLGSRAKPTPFSAALQHTSTKNPGDLTLRYQGASWQGTCWPGALRAHSLAPCPSIRGITLSRDKGRRREQIAQTGVSVRTLQMVVCLFVFPVLHCYVEELLPANSHEGKLAASPHISCFDTNTLQLQAAVPQNLVIPLITISSEACAPSLCSPELFLVSVPLSDTQEPQAGTRKPAQCPQTAWKSAFCATLDKIRR